MSPQKGKPCVSSLCPLRRGGDFFWIGCPFTLSYFCTIPPIGAHNLQSTQITNVRHVPA